MRAGPWSLKDSLISTPILSCSPVDCRCVEKGQNCRLDTVLIIGMQNVEADVEKGKSSCERAYLYMLDTHLDYFPPFHPRKYLITY